MNQYDTLVRAMLPDAVRYLRNLLILLTIVLVVAGCAGPRKASMSRGDLIGYSEKGKASYYAMKFQFRQTASGERFNQLAMTAAHKTLPFGTVIRVTNVKNNRSVDVRVNDRGPFVKGRIVDLSRSAFSKIGNTASGVISVRIEVIQ